MTASSMLRMTMMAKCTRSMFMCLSVGRMIGTTIKMTEMISRKQPRMSKKTLTASRKARGEKSSSTIQRVK